MKNREKFEKEIMEIACNGDSIATIEKSGRIVPCDANRCSLCLFRSYDCKEKTRKWAESEYVEKLVISKKDRAFLDYLRKEYKFIARDDNGYLYAYTSIQAKLLGCAFWRAGDACKSLGGLDIDFPMVKWSDKKPWLIEDLKRLEVVDEYEK